ncbi:MULTISPECIES: RnfABCDGE type electron transport complex subunit G [Candidatus Ichthyocystis]|uniref:Ion-translocating oxidoreductase complex subunit G n=1 Tax=Candidatus Ichthyocystis hellenicum TaxID=1561003 RepID=A0A0S4LZC3_9BURK|nr:MULTISPECIES: RnfABCDGE type electron transport complex subunit G [Ichthyocystis]CUT16921.1 putative electron transport complex protein RnfG [Candidatus Ichthyocystis hellenicum]
MSRLHNTISTVTKMVGFSIVFTLIMASVYEHTKSKIHSNAQYETRTLLHDLTQGIASDGDPIRNSYQKPATEELGTKIPQTVYPIFYHNKPNAVVFSIRAPDGYGGPINAMIAIEYSGKIIGIRVLSHKETPGLGDYIDGKHGAFSYQWIRQFQQRSFSSSSQQNWKVKKDGGTFGYMAGATISPRALIKAVSKALKYYNSNRDNFFYPKKGMQHSGTKTIRDSL